MSEDFDTYSDGELLKTAESVRDKNWERTELLNLVERLGTRLEEAMAGRDFWHHQTIGLRKDLSKF
jgi:hypothetical protein